MQNSQRFEFIDGLRGIAALSVVLFHLNLAIQKHAHQALPYYLEQFFFHGYLGIQIFFVLSGFVIAYSLREVRVDLSFFTSFFVRRSLRLDPPYWMVVIISLALAAMASLTFKSGADFPFNGWQIFYNIVYLPDLVQVPLIVPVAWTLCIEFQFYIFFALLLMVIHKFRINNFYVLFLWGILSLFSILQNTPLAVLPLKPVTFIPHWYSFFLGCATCWAMLGKIDKKFLWANYIMITIGSFWTLTPHAIVSVATAVIIHLISEAGGLHRVLRESFFQYMGSISYSLYLIHWPVGMKLVDLGFKGLDYYQPPFAMPLLLISSFALTILSADLFHRIVERPSHLLSRNRNWGRA